MPNTDIILRPGSDLQNRRLDVAGHVFPGFRIRVFPGAAYRNERCQLRIYLDRALDDKDACIIDLGQGWLSPQRAKEWLTLQPFQTPGIRILRCRLRREGTDSLPAETTVTVMNLFKVEGSDPFPATPTFLDGGRVLAIPCAEDLLLHHLPDGPTHRVRVEDPRAGVQKCSWYVSDDGLIIQQNETLTAEDCYRTLRRTLHIQEALSGEQMASFGLAQSECVHPITVPGSVVTWVRGIAKSYQRITFDTTGETTRFYDRKSGKLQLTVAGYLWAMSSHRVGIYSPAGVFSNNVVLRSHGNPLVGCEEVRPVPGVSLNRLVMSQSGLLAAFQVISMSPPTVTTFVDLSSGRVAGALEPGILVHAIVSDRLAWVSTEDDKYCLVLLDWTTGRRLVTVPLEQRAGEAGFKIGGQECKPTFSFGDDPLMPENIAHLAIRADGSGIVCLRHGDDYRVPHIIGIGGRASGSSSSVVVTGRRIRWQKSQSTHTLSDALSGNVISTANTSIAMVPTSPPGAHLDLAGSLDNMVLLVQSHPWPEWVYKDDSSQSFLFQPPPGTYSAHPLATDGDSTVLWLLQSLDGSTTPPTIGPIHLDIWNCHKREHGLVPLSSEKRLQPRIYLDMEAMYMPELDAWIFRDATEAVASGLPGAIRYSRRVRVYTIARDGIPRQLFDRTFRTYSNNHWEDPAVILYRSIPGTLLVYSLVDIRLVDLFTGEEISRMENPFDPSYGVPRPSTRIRCLPDGWVWLELWRHDYPTRFAIHPVLGQVDQRRADARMPTVNWSGSIVGYGPDPHQSYPLVWEMRDSQLSQQAVEGRNS